MECFQSLLWQGRGLLKAPDLPKPESLLSQWIPEVDHEFLKDLQTTICVDKKGEGPEKEAQDLCGIINFSDNVYCLSSTDQTREQEHFFISPLKC